MRRHAHSSGRPSLGVWRYGDCTPLVSDAGTAPGRVVVEARKGLNPEATSSPGTGSGRVAMAARNGRNPEATSSPGTGSGRVAVAARNGLNPEATSSPGTGSGRVAMAARNGRHLKATRPGCSKCPGVADSSSSILCLAVPSGRITARQCIGHDPLDQHLGRGEQNKRRPDENP
jgi:hypothetical protein